jgi:nucleotide-binding universal stress UspA family protein
MSWQPIVVGVDDSPEAAGAAALAGRIAAAAHTSCHLVHATPDAGSPAMVLRQAVTELGAELIVLGGKHHSAIGRWLGGSTSLSVVRTTHVPLLVTVGSPLAIRRVLVAVDASEATVPTLRGAERIAATLGAELRAFSVIEPLPVLPEVTPPYDVAAYYALAEEQLQRDAWSQIRSPGVERLIRYGQPVEVIVQEVTDFRADLLVVGSHGRGWAGRMLVGSVTERLLNQLPTSLLVVPTGIATESSHSLAALLTQHAPSYVHTPFREER